MFETTVPGDSRGPWTNTLQRCDYVVSLGMKISADHDHQISDAICGPGSVLDLLTQGLCFAMREDELHLDVPFCYPRK